MNLKKAERMLKEFCSQADSFVYESVPIGNRESRRAEESRTRKLKKQYKKFTELRIQAEKMIEKIKASETK